MYSIAKLTILALWFVLFATVTAEADPPYRAMDTDVNEGAAEYISRESLLKYYDEVEKDGPTVTLKETVTNTKRHICGLHLNGSYPVVEVPTNETVELLSAQPGANYSRYLHCRLKLRADNSQQITLGCGELDVAPGDYLHVEDLREDGRVQSTDSYVRGETVNYKSSSNFLDVVFSAEGAFTGRGFKCHAVAVNDTERIAWISERYTWPSKPIQNKFNKMGKRLTSVLDPRNVTLGVNYFKSSPFTLYTVVNKIGRSAVQKVQEPSLTILTNLHSTCQSSTMYLVAHSLDIEESLVTAIKDGGGERTFTVTKAGSTGLSNTTKRIDGEIYEVESFTNHRTITTALDHGETNTVVVSRTMRTKLKESTIIHDKDLYQNDLGNKIENTTNTNYKNSTEFHAIVKSSQIIIGNNPFFETPNL